MTTDPPSAASLPASADSTLDSSGPVSALSGRSRSTLSTGLCLITDFPIPDNMRTFVRSCQDRRTGWTASSEASPARTSAMPAPFERQAGSACPESGAGSSSRRCGSSAKFGPFGWCLKTSKHSAFPTRGTISPPSSSGFETAGMWDSGGLLTLAISEAPSVAAASSWSPVFDSAPPLSCWLMPDQWRLYLARCLRAASQSKRIHGLALLFSPQTPARGSLLAANFSWLTRTDGIRWLSGRESLAAMGFSPDWMRPAVRRRGVPETPLTLVSRNGSRGSSSPHDPAPGHPR